MKRLLTASIFGTILGIVGAGTANASIVSSGFLDEKLTEYALSTSLDLKANQSDLTALSNKIGTLPSGDFPWFAVDTFLFSALNQPLTYPTSLAELINAIYGNSEIRQSGLLAGIISGFLVDNDQDGRPETPIGLIPNYDLAKAANDKIGTLPEGITVQGMYEGWTDKNGSNPGIKGMFEGWTVEGGTYFPGLYSYSKGETLLQRAYDPDNSGLDFSRLLINGANATTIRGVDYTGPVYPLWKLSEGIDKIGDLPSGKFPGFPGYEFLFTELDQPLTYPTSLAELIFAIYGDAGPSRPGLLAAISAGFRVDLDQDGSPDALTGLIPNYQLAKNANDKIGTLPTGTPLVLTDSMENLNERSSFKYKINYPKSLSDLIVDLYGATDPSNPGLLSLFTSAIADMVWPHEEALFGSSSNNIKGLLERMDNAETKIAKIGTLPSAILPTFWTDIPYYTEFGENMPDIPLAPTIGEQLELLFNGGLNSPIDRMFRVMIGAGDTFPVGTMDPGSGNPQAEFLGLISLTQKVRSIDAKIGTVPDGQTVAGMATTANTNATTAKNTADSAIEKIGTLPTEYATVGAALSAIKGIAEEAKTAALAAIPDPKTEGATGKYVLTVDIIDSSATPVYRWEKIDRESEPTITE